MYLNIPNVIPMREKGKLQAQMKEMLHPKMLPELKASADDQDLMLFVAAPDLTPSCWGLSVGMHQLQLYLCQRRQNL